MNENDCTRSHFQYLQTERETENAQKQKHTQTHKTFHTQIHTHTPSLSPSGAATPHAQKRQPTTAITFIVIVVMLVAGSPTTTPILFLSSFPNHSRQSEVVRQLLFVFSLSLSLSLQRTQSPLGPISLQLLQPPCLQKRVTFVTYTPLPGKKAHRAHDCCDSEVRDTRT